jgi:Na+/H+ antiporter NhaC
MIEDELVRIWQSSPNQERVKFEKSRLMIEVQSNIKFVHKAVKYRDLMDTISLMIVIPVFAFGVYFVPFTLSKIASGLISIWGVYMIIRLRKAKKNKPGAMTGTYLEYLQKNRQFLRDQKELMDTVLYWAVIPLITLVSLFFIGVFVERPGPPIKRAIALGGNVVLGVVVYLMNKWAVRVQIMPRLHKVDEVIKVMQQE